MSRLDNWSAEFFALSEDEAELATLHFLIWKGVENPYLRQDIQSRIIVLERKFKRESDEASEDGAQRQHPEQ